MNDGFSIDFGSNAIVGLKQLSGAAAQDPEETAAIQFRTIQSGSDPLVWHDRIIIDPGDEGDNVAAVAFKNCNVDLNGNAVINVGIIEGSDDDGPLILRGDTGF